MVKLPHPEKTWRSRRLAFNRSPTRAKSWRGRNRLHHGQHQDAPRGQGRRHDPGLAIRRGAAGDSGRSIRWSSAASIRSTRRITRCATEHGQASAQRLGADLPDGKFCGAGIRAALWVSWGCCTWRSCRNASAGSSTWTSSPPTRAWYRVRMTDGVERGPIIPPSFRCDPSTPFSSRW